MRARQWIIWRFIRDRYHPYRYHMSGDDMLMTIQIVNEKFFNEWKCDALTIVVFFWEGEERRVRRENEISSATEDDACWFEDQIPLDSLNQRWFPFQQLHRLAPVVCGFQKIKISQQPPRPTHAGLINSFSIHPESWVWSDSTFNGIRVFVQKKDKRRMVSCLRNLKERKSPILNFRTAWLIEVAAISSSEKAPLMIQHGPRTENQFTKEKLWDMREKKWMNNCATLRSN